MSDLLKDIVDELKTFIKGNTFDVVVPPLLFIIINNFTSLYTAIIISLGVALCVVIIRVIRRQKWQYSVGGLIGILVASTFGIIAGNAKDYFLPELISALFFSLLSLVSLLIKKPLAAWTSHISRGWNREWYWRRDILPAYQEVTVFWTIFLFMRLLVLTYVYVNGSAVSLYLSNLILGFPMTIVVLVITYVYGIWRLKKLGGPGIDEFINDIPAPWHGQKKGF